MRRRQFLTTLTAATVGSSSVAGAFTTNPYSLTTAVSDPIADLEFYSTASLLDSNYGELTDPGVVAVRAKGTATNHDSDGDGYGTAYSESTPVPLVATDWNVVGFAAMMVTNADTNWQRGNEEFVLNVWDVHLGGSGTVVWDEGHSQYYTLAKFSEFETYAEDNGYTVQATTNLTSKLNTADAAVITSPSTAFTNKELKDLYDFVAAGGTLFLHDQSDYGNYDETANLNDLAGYLGLAFRFNDDEVLDEVVNGGSDYQPVTDEFNTSFDYFADRPGLGLDPTATYTVPVTDVIDGDTVKVQFADGTIESIRVLGIDTPEKAANSQHERIQEWEGIEDSTYLENWAADATTWATNELNGTTVDLTFDPNEPVRDAFGRVLGYIYYDQNGDGTRSTLYNQEALRQGWGRLYDSGLSKHDQFWDAENEARTNGRRVWQQSDPANSTEIRNNPVDDLFFPETASVRTSSGAVADSRVPVYAESSASQDLDGGVSYSQIPLAAVDESARVAVVGAPLIDEGYESAEGYAVDTSTYENYVFLTNLVDYLPDTSGDVLIDGGHGQFAASYGLSAEDAAYYQRYLEGQDIGFEGVNTIDSSNLSRGRTLLVTTPTEAFAQSEIDAINSFVADGGSVVLLGSGETTAEARSNLNGLASGLGTDLRLNADQVLDSTSNVNSDPEIVATTAFDTSFPLFSAYSGGGGASFSIPTIHEDASGNDGDNLNDEYVVFENGGSAAVDMTGWSVEDAAAHTYTFPDGFSLGAGSQVTLHTGSGSDTATDLYWGRGSPVWNNDGDTVSLYDNAATLVAERSYPTDSSNGQLTVAQIHEDASGNDTNNLNDEYVVFENTGSSGMDVTGYTCQDEAGKTYAFPDGFTLGAGAQVTLHSGSGTDTATDLYWGRSGSAVWNNGGDTVYVYDDAGSLVVEESY